MATSSRTRNQSRNSRYRGTNASSNGSNSIYKELHGAKFLPSEMPPSFVAQPWNNIVLIIRKRQSPPIQITIADVRTALQAQSGFTNVPVGKDEKVNVHFDLRFKSYSVWAIDSKPMSMLPMDLLNNKAELCRIDSNPQKNMYARAGYRLPLAQSSVTYSTFAQSNVVVLNLQNSTEYEIHINLLWKGADTSLPSLSYVYPDHKRRRHNFKTKLLSLIENLESTDDDNDEDVKSVVSSLQSSLQIVDE